MKKRWMIFLCLAALLFPAGMIRACADPALNMEYFYKHYSEIMYDEYDPESSRVTVSDTSLPIPTPGPGGQREEIDVIFQLEDGTIVHEQRMAASVTSVWYPYDDRPTYYYGLSHAEMNQALPAGYEVDPSQADPLLFPAENGTTVTVLVRKTAQSNVIPFRAAALSTFAPEENAQPGYLFDNFGNLLAVSGGNDALPRGFAFSETAAGVAVRSEEDQEAALAALLYSLNENGQYVLEGFVRDTPDDSWILPYGTAEIGAYAFSENLTLRRVVIVRSVQMIGEGAFQGCANLSEIFLPADVWILEGAFDGIAPDAVFHVPEGSAAERWCRENGKAFAAYESPDGNGGTEGVAAP